MSLGACLVVVAGPRPAAAHQVGLSRGVYTVDGATVRAELTFARGELRALVPELDGDGDGALAEAELRAGAAALQARVVAGVVLEGDGARCVGVLEGAGLTEEDGAAVTARYTCPQAPRALALELTLFAGLAAGHRHLAQFVRPEADPEDSLAEPVLHGRAPGARVDLATETPAAPPLGAYFNLGVEHILIGTDHLVFLVGLMAVGGRLRSLIAVITAFTVGHSLSLALAALGVWSPGAAIVEPAIALSIAYVGVENLIVADARGRWRITLPFGFVHGFGFAGVLAEIGLPGDAVAPALLLFNLGVEVGQLMVVALVLPLLLWLARQRLYRRIGGVRWISVAIVAAGVYWFVARVFLGG